MILSAADFYTYFKPSRCQRRVHLIHHPPESVDTEDLEGFYARSQEADFHVERYYYKRMPQPLDLSQLPDKERRKATLEAILRQEPVIYKPLLTNVWRHKGRRFNLEARPDFMIWSEDRYTLRQCRMGKKINRENHPDVFWVSQFNGWVYKRLFDQWPDQLEVGNSTGHVFSIPKPENKALENLLDQIISWRESAEIPYHPVSWTKCQSCYFRDYCWNLAESTQDISLIPNLEASLLLALRDSGLVTVQDVFDHQTLDSLSEFTWIERISERKIGLKKAQGILHMAASLLTQKPILTGEPNLPETDNWIMFDVEGVPARPGQPEKVYLWGMYLKGSKDQNLQQLSPTLNRQADRDNWFEFLERARAVFEEYGDVPFIHWGSFEPYCIKLYTKRFGDRRGVARRIHNNLLDFFEVLKRTVVIPLPSYSLKVIEKYVGFDRQDQDTGGYWSVVNYLKSVSTKNKEKRAEILEQLREYNCSDLEAMWHVLEWFQKLIKENHQV